MTYLQQLLQDQADRKSYICAGVDTDDEKMPKGRSGQLLGRGSLKSRLLYFGKQYLYQLFDRTCVCKPNLAFWAAYGAEDTLTELIQYAHDLGMQVILDAKYGDIGNTARFYAKTAFERFKADAVTVNAYLGSDTLDPWLDYGPEHAVYVLCHTSNPGAGEFQEQMLSSVDRQLFVHLADKVTAKQKDGCTQIGLVMGATFPEQIKLLHGVVPDDTTPLLLPGIGKQEGALLETIRNARRYPFVVNMSRELMYAARNRHFAQAAAAKAGEYNIRIAEVMAATA